MKTRKEKAQKIISMIDSRIIDLQTLKGGWIMSTETFKQMLKDHPQLKDEFEILNHRRFKIERILWKCS